MCIRFSIFRDCRKGRCEVVAPISSSSSFNLCEEYTNAFRTESYTEFWAQVLDLTLDHGDALKPRGSSAAARLPSYFLLLAEHLLSPDQTTVAKILAHLRTRSRPETHALLSDYYVETADASHLCGLLLKDIDQIRRRYRPLKATLQSLVAAGSSSGNGLRAVGDCVADISKASNPFNSLASSQRKFRAVQEDSADLLKRLESGRKKARQKRRFINRVKRAVTVSAIVLVASTSIVGALVAIHALVAAIALPGFLSASPRVGSVRQLDRAIAQLDAAAKGTYILNRDLDTISRLVARLYDETEHMHGLLRLCEWQEDDGCRRRLTQEVARQIWKSLGSFNQQLDELEEHLYLCFMTINKARRLVIKELGGLLIETSLHSVERIQD